MQKQIDQVVAQPFVIATGALLLHPFAGHFTTNDRPVIFTCAPLGEEGSLADLARDEGMDIICLAFEPGRERKGPRGVAVYEEVDGEIRAWADCAMWADADVGIFLVMSRCGGACFGIDGRSIVRVRGGPKEGIDEGVALAKAMLRRAVRNVPSDLPTRRLR